MRKIRWEKARALIKGKETAAQKGRRNLLLKVAEEEGEGEGEGDGEVEKEGAAVGEEVERWAVSGKICKIRQQ